MQEVQDRIHFLLFHNVGAQLSAVANAFQVLPVMFLHNDDAVAFAMMFYRSPELFGAKLNAIFNSRLRQQFTGFDVMARAFKNPGVANSTAPNHDTINAGFVEHAFGVFG